MNPIGRILVRWQSFEKTSMKRMYIKISSTQLPTGWRRVIGCLISIRHISRKSPRISGFFTKNHLQLKASYGSLPRISGFFTQNYLQLKASYGSLPPCTWESSRACNSYSSCGIEVNTLCGNPVQCYSTHWGNSYSLWEIEVNILCGNPTSC